MTGISVERRAELRALADAARNDPWTFAPCGDRIVSSLTRGRMANGEPLTWHPFVCDTESFGYHSTREFRDPGEDANNAVQILLARSAVPELLDEIDRLDSENTRLIAGQIVTVHSAATAERDRLSARVAELEQQRQAVIEMKNDREAAEKLAGPAGHDGDGEQR